LRCDRSGEDKRSPDLWADHVAAVIDGRDSNVVTLRRVIRRKDKVKSDKQSAAGMRRFFN
jgi:hypothetical protein